MDGPVMPRMFFFGLLALVGPGVVWAHGGDHGPAQVRVRRKASNLQVLPKQSLRTAKAGMKRLSTGLGVDCSSCHTSSAFAEDSLAAKQAARDFFWVVRTSSAAHARQRALTSLVLRLRLDRIHDERIVWKACEQLGLPTKKGKLLTFGAISGVER